MWSQKTNKNFKIKQEGNHKPNTFNHSISTAAAVLLLFCSQFTPRRFGWGKVKANHIITVAPWAIPLMLEFPPGNCGCLLLATILLNIHPSILCCFSLNEREQMEQSILFIFIIIFGKVVSISFNLFDPSEPLHPQRKNQYHRLCQNLWSKQIFLKFLF